MVLWTLDRQAKILLRNIKFYFTTGTFDLYCLYCEVLKYYDNNCLKSFLFLTFPRIVIQISGKTFRNLMILCKQFCILLIHNALIELMFLAKWEVLVEFWIIIWSALSIGKFSDSPGHNVFELENVSKRFVW